MDNRTIENRSLHRSSQHRIAEERNKAGIRLIRMWVAELFLECLPVNIIVGPQKSQIWIYPSR